MIPRQPRQISFNDELTQTLEKVPPPGILVLLIYTLLVFTTLTLLYFYAGFSIPLVYPYLKDQVIGPDNRIIQCDQIYSSGSSQDQWCAYHQRLILCKRGYKISKLWVVYQYQYRKGLFLTWLKEQKEKSRQQHIESAGNYFFGWMYDIMSACLKRLAFYDL
ncbi:1752_t:CDS:2 [Gigaspora rosea]|nr:1752_t:CDS:2 [Gigaspora rosea]